MNDDARTGELDPGERAYGATFWVGTAVGWAIILYGAKLLFDDPEASWYNTVRLAAIGLVAHDVVWLGLSVGVAWLAARALGRPVPFWVRWATWTTAIVVAMWFPLWRRYGDRLRNDTILPRDYATSIVILLIVIWVAAFAYELVRRRRAVASPVGDQPPDPDSSGPETSPPVSPGPDSPGPDSPGPVSPG